MASQEKVDMESKPKLQNLLKQDESLSLKTDLFYREAADTTVRLEDDKILKFNRAALCITSGSSVLYQLFFGMLKEPDITDFIDVDYDTFKLFLDCIMGYKPYTFDNADQIFPVAWKYQIENVIDRCVEALTPKKMSEKIIELLNMAVFCKCNKLIHEITCFVWFTYSPYKLLEKEAYCHVLEPKSMKLILSMPDMTMDSNVLMALQKWIEHYMTNNTDIKLVQSFLEKYKLSQFFKLEYFETTSSISKFCLSEIGKEIFPIRDVLTHLEDSENLIHAKSRWQKMKKDATVTEYIICPTMANTEYSNYKVRINIERNKIVPYGNITTAVGEGSCSIQLTGQDDNGDQLFQISQEEFPFSYCDSPETDRNHYISCIWHGIVNNNRQLTRCTLKITWTFPHKCRVLLMNRPGDKLNGSEKLYFTKSVSASF